MTTPAPAPSSTPSEVIQFGQPLPGVSAPKSFLLPKGTVLTLRFPGNTAMNLQSGMPRQEVLLLAADVRDGVGRVIFSAGTPVTGRFETSGAGSRFITQAIALAGRSIPLSAQSEPMAGGRRLSENSLLQNVGIGAVAGAVLSDFSGFGVLGGAATGAAVTYLTSPRPATIQPNQQIQVRLTEELRQY
jgi:small-conductance mechanosensitive channel